VGLKTVRDKHKNTLPLSELAYRVLRDATVHGVLPESENLTERSLADALGLSRTPSTTPSRDWRAKDWFGSHPTVWFRSPS